MSLKEYLRVYKTEFLVSFAWRFNFLIWAFLQPMYLVISYFVWSAIYGGSGAIMGLTFAQLISFKVFNAVFDTYANVDWRISEEINNGSIITYFIKPINFFLFELFVEFGHRSVAFLMHMLPTLVFGIFVFSFRPTSFILTALGVFSFFLAFGLSFIINFIMGLTTFWAKHYFGTARLKQVFFWLLGGGFIPIIFFPTWVQKILLFTPFPYVEFIPGMIFVGYYSVAESLKFIALQFGWLLILFFVWRFVFSKAYKKFTGVGV